MQKIYVVTDKPNPYERRKFLCYAENARAAKFKVACYLQEHKQDDLEADAVAMEVLYIDEVFAI